MHYNRLSYTQWQHCVCVCFVLAAAPAASPAPSKYIVNYVTSHKGPCLTAAFSCDGKLAAAASADCSIKVYISLTYYIYNVFAVLKMYSTTGDGC